jgi:peptidyl-prolyl cis-trans isomerase SurA
MMKRARILTVIALALATSLALPAAHGGFAAQAASTIKVVVNNQAITSVDLSRRVAFLRLQRTKGNLNQIAREQLIEEALKTQEINRTRAGASQAEVDAAFERFASSNKLKVAQLNQILAQAGVTSKHFKEFIRVQMSWPRLVQARYGGAGGKLSNEQLVAKMLEQGGNKPSTTEYILQQVIFVVPANKRSNAVIGARKREADQLRGRYTGCQGTRDIVTGLRDVTVRELGRFLQPQLPPDWKPLIEKTKSGGATTTRVTEKGVEFIGVCSSRSVSDDVAAAMVFQAENSEAGDTDDAKKYLEELRSRAVIANK